MEDIKKQSVWTVKALKSDGIEMDYSIGSLIEIDRFNQKHTKDGQPIKGGRLAKGYGGKIFSIGSYI
ncbi:hypothetical protein LDL77_15950 [Flagellimonas marinaquae]|nr:hypothetical protein LDL77_15950 [Allomuricauda aquimarina]